MKLLCVIPSYWPAFQYGGPIFSVHYLNKFLVRKGIDVTVYTTNVGLEEKVSVNQEVNIDGVKVNYFTFTKLLEFMGTPGWQFSWGITKALKKNLQAFDLIYIVTIWSYPQPLRSIIANYIKSHISFLPEGCFIPICSLKRHGRSGHITILL